MGSLKREMACASHSGEPFDNADWGASVFNNTLTWKSPQTYAQNTNANALRWGTLYNFRFDANVPPATGDATIGIFKQAPGLPDFVAASASGSV